VQKRLFIAWETQRRSGELARQLRCEFHVLDERAWQRYPRSIWATLNLLRQSNPDVLIVQNPSMVLAAVACVVKVLTGLPVVVDRHTTFLLDRRYPNTPAMLVFRLLHKFTIRLADITIVTNEFLAGLVRDAGGRPVVLPDRLPEFQHPGSMTLDGTRNVLLIASHGIDEPIEEAVNAMRSLTQAGVRLYITGKSSSVRAALRRTAPPNVVFTGFLSEEDFIGMLHSVDAVVVLTTAEACMLCGCYEAVAAGAPLVTSNKKALRDYFTEAIFVDNTPEGIAAGIGEALANGSHYRERIGLLRDRLTREWSGQYSHLECAVSGLRRS
jgi:glycosyltransferase involved in cell wall biosynthesis